MRIFKFLLTVCVATACASLISARADQDNPAQAAARAALIEKMNDLDNGQPSQTPTNTTAPAETNPPAATTTPATPPPIVVTASGATVEQPSQPTNPVVQSTEPAPAPAPETTPTSVSAPAAAPVVTSPPANPVVQPTEPAPAPVVAAPPVVETKPAASNPSVSEMQPIVAPPLPISASKESQLQALLEKYKADQITPEEYQKQRAAILAQPD
jgi:hypothetical protein